jgi:hypothetical protein
MLIIDQLSRGRWMWLVTGGAVAAASVFSGCSGGFDSCSADKNCGPYDGPMAGAAGKGGQGGASGIGGASAQGGQAGSAGGSSGISGTAGEAGAAGQAGTAGSGGREPCNGACSGAMPVCKMDADTCVECLEKAQCSGSKPACDTTTNACVECTEKADCTDVAKPFCDSAASQCVACLQQSDCKDAASSKCDAGACKPCTTDTDCSGIAGKGVCDAGACVQCTGAKFAACGNNAGTPLVCDSVMRTCTTTKQHSSGLCQPCVTDAQCNAGEVCTLDKFGTPSKDVGYFCHWKQGDTAEGAPANCSVTGMPYVGTQVAATSIDGTVGDICTLRSSTCVANNQFSSKDCTVASAPSDAACGVSPPKDAKCALYNAGAGTYRCTMTCLSDDDCPGTTCNTGVTPRVCLLQ